MAADNAVSTKREALYFYEKTGWRLVPTAVWVLLLLGGLVAVVVVGTTAKSDFLGQSNVQAMLDEFLVPAVLVPAMVLVVAGGGIDFSIGAVAMLAGILTAKWVPGLKPQQAALQAIGIAAGVGLVNGLFVSVARIRGALVTLGSMAAVTGVCLLLGKGVAVNADNLGFIAALPATKWPWVAVIIAGLVGIILMQLTPFGRRPKPREPEHRERCFARFFYRTVPYILSGLAAGCVGVYLLGKPASSGTFPTEPLQIVKFSAENVMFLTVLAAVLLGGTPLGGGFGTVLGGLIALLLLTVGKNVAVLKGAPQEWIVIGQGGVILAAAFLGQIFFGIFSAAYSRKRAGG